MRQLFLDCDGVLADFDTVAEKIFGIPSREAEEKFGTDRFWHDLRSAPGFYETLPLMPNARKLFEAVVQYDPVILTGCPQGGWAESQKHAWALEHFPETRIICCMSRDKRLHMKPGDILVDDWPQYKDRWTDHGGIFLLYEDAKVDEVTSEVHRLMHEPS